MSREVVMTQNRIVRVLLAKPGLDTHETGVKLLTAGLRDAGMEVIYAGVFQQARNIARMALEEDVDVVGLSFLNGGHVGLTRGVIHAMVEAGVGDIPVIVGGIIPQADIAPLRELGVAGIYGPATAIGDVATDIRRLVQMRAFSAL
jgi:methylmalonyl-CoA mutase C-terminal domain/subunit